MNVPVVCLCVSVMNVCVCVLEFRWFWVIKGNGYKNITPATPPTTKLNPNRNHPPCKTNANHHHRLTPTNPLAQEPSQLMGERDGKLEYRWGDGGGGGSGVGGRGKWDGFPQLSQPLNNPLPPEFTPLNILSSSLSSEFRPHFAHEGEKEVDTIDANFYFCTPNLFL